MKTKTSITRREFFRQVPHAFHDKANLLGYLCQLRELGLVYHLDDDPRTIVNNSGRRTFTRSEAVWLARFVAALEVFRRDRKIINDGAWRAAEIAGFYRDYEWTANP